MKERKVPMRKCVGCMQSKEKQTLTRIALYEGQICVDPSGRAKGRGVYLCKNSPDCLEKADKRRALMLGDSLSSDIAAAKNADVDACWFNPKGMKNDKGLPIAYDIRSLDEVDAILRGEEN